MNYCLVSRKSYRLRATKGKMLCCKRLFTEIKWGNLHTKLKRKYINIKEKKATLKIFYSKHILTNMFFFSALLHNSDTL